MRELPPEYPVYYFFLRNVDNCCKSERDHRSAGGAQLIGYALVKWGDYLALIDGKQGQVVSGYAYLVQCEEEAQKLAYYETNAYRVVDCWVFFTDDKEPSKAAGQTFKYAGDAKALLEQRFDRKLWTLQIGGKLGWSNHS
jgi:hypothetical protein